MAEKNEGKPKPIHSIRIEHVEATIWDNSYEYEKRKVFSANVTFQRHYYDQKKKEWGNSKSFDKSNLLTLALVVSKAYEWIAEWEYKQKLDAKESN